MSFRLNYTLIVFTDDNGTQGFKLADTPNIEGLFASNGALLAHDILEHINGPEHIGGIDDELEAMGAAWFVRGQYGAFSRNARSYYTPHDGIASDITNIFRDNQYSDAEYQKGFVFDSGDTPDVDFQDIIERAKISIPKEFYDEGKPTEFEIQEYLAAAYNRMRVGYSKAESKYKDLDVNTLFFDIEDRVNSVLKEGVFDSQEFNITLGFRNNTLVPFVQIEEKHHEEFNED